MDEINRVARVMVDAEPAVDLAARIRERLDDVPARRAWPMWQVAAGLALAATIAMFVWVPGRGSRVPGPGSVEVQGSRGLEVLGSSLAVAGGEGGSPSRTLPPFRHSTGGSRAQVQVTRALSAEELAWMERRIPALDPLIALQVDRLSAESIQPEPLAITPLIMTTLPTSSAEAERHIDR